VRKLISSAKRYQVMADFSLKPDGLKAGLSVEAFLVFLSAAACADKNKGYVMFGQRAATMEDIILWAHVKERQAETKAELLERGLIREDEIGWFIPAFFKNTEGRK